jgi:non-ribosomal peptide synthetase component F
VGHEKPAPFAYLAGVRRVHFVFSELGTRYLRLDSEVPPVDVAMSWVHGRLLTWDPLVVDSLRARGASVPDFPTQLDRILADPSPSIVAIEWLTRDKLRRFYFDQVKDPRREAALVERLSVPKVD